MKERVIAFIPARWGSKRFPGKPLADLGGKSMIHRVYEAVQKTKVDEICVATDDERIINEVQGFGGNAVMTDVNHLTGTDRIIEAFEQYKDKFEYVINVQGDEPTIHEEDINSLINILKETPYHIATLVGLLEDSQKKDRNTVKAYIEDNLIRMFTRSPLISESVWVKRHIGVYGFSKAILHMINKMKPTLNEKAENLEQLRWADHNIHFTYVIAQGMYKGIDTPEDLEKVKSFFLN